MNFYCQAGYKNSSDRIYIYFAPRDPSTGEPITGWSSTGNVYMDVLSIKWSTVLFYDLVVSDQAMETLTLSAAPYLSQTMWATSLMKSQLVSPTNGAVQEAAFLIVFKNESGSAPSKWLYGIFNTTADGTSFTALGDRLDWIRNDIENVVFPRTKRALALLGENLVLDNFTYDDASNISAFRIRIFEDEANALAATEDYAGADMESGETVRYTVSQTHDTDRNLRSLHRSSIDTDQSDSPTFENTNSSTTAAPGNTGAFPSGEYVA